MEMKTVINNILITLSQQNQNIQQLDAALSSYIDYKGDKDKWIKSVNKNKGDENGQNGTKSGNSTNANQTNAPGKQGT
tara:strand:- start:420 stop:653 length:234 start_codon:yes stop_codon:yes gene_type:complete